MSDFKAPIYHSEQEEQDVKLPSYDESMARELPLPSSSNTAPSSHIHQQLQSLIHQITITQAQNSHIQSLQLQQSLDLLKSQIEPFFASFSRSGLQKGTLYLIPAGCISRGAKLADLDLRGGDEFVEVTEVGNGKEEVVDLGYWKDEAIAKKLAGELQPKQTTAPASNAGKEQKGRNTSSGSASNANAGGSSGKWYQFSSKSNPKTSTSNTTTPYQTPVEVAETRDKLAGHSREGEANKVSAVMSVRGEEVVFRSANDFGLWKSERGFAVVMRFNVTLK